MMNFRTLKANLICILGDAEFGRYRTVGYQHQGSGAEEFTGLKRRVQVVVGSGDFPKSKSGMSSYTQHDLDFGIELTVSSNSVGDLSVLNDENATESELLTALDRFQDASEIADNSFDELVEIVYQILMDGNNIYIGTTGLPHIVSSRWSGGWSKDKPMNFGKQVVITGTIQFTCQTEEEITGDTGTSAGDGPFNQTLDLDGDDNEKTGATV